METLITVRPNNRRDFLTRCFAAGSFLCFGCLGAGAAIKDPAIPGIQPQSGLPGEEALRFALGYALPLLLKMQDGMGKMPFLELLEKCSAATMAEKMTALSKDIKDRSMKKFGELIIQLHSTSPVKDAITYEITEQSDKVFEMKVTGCLMARLYKEMRANYIGYSIECHPSDAAVKAFNPQAKCSKLRNMMIGDPFCVERYELA